MSICGNLPINPSQSTAVVGKDFLLFVDKGAIGAPVWVLVGGQRSSDLSRSAETIDTSSKSSGNWGGGMPGVLTWSMDLDAITVLNDEGARVLECCFNNRIQAHCRLDRPDGTHYEGWGAITDLSLSVPHDDVASLTGTITGDGELVGPSPALAPLRTTYSLAAGTALTFTVEPASVGVTAVSCDGAALSAGNFTYTTGELTISDTFLGTLAVGTHSFKVITDDASPREGVFAELGYYVSVTA